MTISMAMLSSIIVAFSGIFAGTFLAYHTCEELKSIEKILRISKSLLFLIGFVLINYIFFGWNVGFFVLLPLIAIIFTIFTGIKKFMGISKSNSRKFDITSDNIILIFFLIIFISKNNILIGGIVFLIGIISGTLETKNYLFKNFNHNEFTTLTTFDTKNKISFYLNTFKSYQLVLYIPFLYLIITSIF